jgi:hypothetical protein
MRGKPQHHRPHHCADAMTLCTLSEAAKKLGICKQAAHAIERRALAKIRVRLIAMGTRPEDFGRGA